MTAVAAAQRRSFSDAEVDAIVTAVAAGQSLASVARAHGSTHQAVARIAARHGIKASESRQAFFERVTRAASDFNRARQLTDLDNLARKVREHIESAERVPAADLKNLSIALGVAIDKRRLIDDLSTSNAAVQVKAWGRRQLPKPDADDS